MCKDSAFRALLQVLRKRIRGRICCGDCSEFLVDVKVICPRRARELDQAVRKGQGGLLSFPLFLTTECGQLAVVQKAKTRYFCFERNRQ